MSNAIGIVWNPSKTDKGELGAAFDEALAGTAGDASREVLWFETAVDDPGRGAAASAVEHGCTLVIAAGGDGTVRAVAEYLGGSGSPKADLGIVPLGTGNLLARNLGVPLGSPRAAIELALRSEGAPLDLGQVEFTTSDGATQQLGFVVMVGFGIDAQMIVETDDELKAKAGWLAYVESLGRAASGTEVVEFAFTQDEGETVQEQAHTLLVANCGSIQGGVTLLPDARPDDGELDLLLLRADGAVAWLDTMRNMTWDNGLKRLFTRASTAESSESTAHLRARRVLVSLPVPLAFEVDGEDVGEVSSFEATILPGALRVRA
ncbi:diacylglycerol/lipid kinase family protein [Leucobacter salsicius]|uniref:diacylglycerol/lipid kinase family protein n=1 Tax=Leucobacter salsicius TaxID=664638 RepID=UPI000346191A|nr:diacylglycerol kinase family protein [Leucobacter salsicius]